MHHSNSSPISFTIHFSRSCLFITALAVSISILFLAETTYSNQIQHEKEIAELYHQAYVSPSSNSNNHDNSGKKNSKEKIMNKVLEEQEVEMDLPFGSGNDQKILSYYHCGTTTISSSSSSKEDEILLLHGAAFTKRNWIESGIFQHLCWNGNINNNSKNGRRLSVTALDLSVRADGRGLKSAFDALVKRGVLSGKPVVVVTPSASGLSIVSMVTDIKDTGSESSSLSSSLLQELVKAWIPVASFAVLQVKNEKAFQIFPKLNIPILAINGDEDVKGKKVTEKLVDVAHAKGLEMKGGHPCYLDSPRVFEDAVLSFLDDLQVDMS